MKNLLMLIKSIKTITFLLCFLIFSCSTINANIVKESKLTFNVDNTTNPKGSFSVNLTLNNLTIKSNSNGQVKKTKSDISLVRIYLVDNNTSTLGDSNIKYGPLDITSSNTGSLLTFFNNVKGSGGTGNITFTNVGQGTYYVAISTFDSTSSLDYTKNITNNTTNTVGAYTTITSSSINLGRFALSTSGGDSNSGKIQIGGNSTGYNLVNNGTSSLNINLALKSELGATVDSTTTITEGSSSIPATSLQ